MNRQFMKEEISMANKHMETNIQTYYQLKNDR